MIQPALMCRDLIGRVAEFGFLLDRLRPDDAGPRVVLLRGEPGVGKTRLVRELAAVARRASVPFASGSCWELSSSAYTPFVETIEALGVAEPRRIRALEAAAATLRSSGGADGSVDRHRRYAAATDAIAGDDAPRVVVVEDLHWGDAATLDLFRHLGETLPRRGGLLIGTARDEPPDDPLRARSLVELERNVPALIEVRPLDDGAIERLVRTAAADAGRDLPALAVADIVRLAEGRPYAAEELLRAYVDGAAGAVVPASIRSAVRARLDALAEDERLILAHAAAIGRRFDADLVAELAERSVAAVLHVLRRARNAQLVTEDDDGAFRFRHALTRDVVYGELLRAEARALHRKIADRLEREGGDPSVIAEHAWCAGDTARTLRWSLEAGDAAVRLHAHADAARFLSRAHDAAGDPATRAALAERVAAEQHDLGDHERAAAWLERGHAAHREAGNVAAARNLAARRARVMFEGGAIDDGLSAALALAEEVRDVAVAERFEIDIMLAGLYSTLGRGREALEALHDAAGEIAGLAPRDAARLRSFRASCFGMIGRYAEAREDFAAAEAFDRSEGDREHLLRTLNNHADLETALGRLDVARTLNDEALALARRTHAATHLPWLLLNAAQIDLFAGRFDGAHDALDEIGSRPAPGMVGHWWTALRLRLATLCGVPDEALAADAAARLTAAHADRDAQSVAILAGALAQRALTDGSDAAGLVGAALEALDGINAATWLLDTVPVLLPAKIDAARAILARAAAAPENRLAGAHLVLFDARVALRRNERNTARERAADAAERFAAIARPYERAVAIELAGDRGAALAILRELGAGGEVRRRTAVEAAKRGAPGEGLTAREREIGRLIAAGLSNRAIAERLVIGERTVETHVAGVMRKLGVARRAEVSGLLDP